MKPLLFLLLPALLLVACNEHGSSVAVNGHKVYYGGKGNIKGDAKKLAAFLVQRNFFNTDTDRVVQLSKSHDTFVVRVAEAPLKLAQSKVQTLFEYKVWQMWIADKVFTTAPTKVVVTDKHLNDVLTVGAFTDQEKTLWLSAEGNNTAADSTTTNSGVRSTDSSKK